MIIYSICENTNWYGLICDLNFLTFFWWNIEVKFFSLIYASWIKIHS